LIFACSAQNATYIIDGEGDPRPARLFQNWVAEFHSIRPGTVVNFVVYDVGGYNTTEERLLNLTANGFDFLVVTFPLAKDEYVGGNADLFLVPFSGLSIVPISPLFKELPTGGNLLLTYSSLIGIFSGNITNWDDPAILSTNDFSNTLGSPQITLIVLNNSETTFTLTKVMSELSNYTGLSQRWTYGASFDWPFTGPNVIFAQDLSEAEFLISSTPYSIGYTSLADVVDSLYVVGLQSQSGVSLSPISNSYDTLVEVDRDGLYVPSSALAAQDKSWPIRQLSYVAFHKESFGTTSYGCNEYQQFLQFVLWIITNSTSHIRSIDGYSELDKTSMEIVAGPNSTLVLLTCTGSATAVPLLEWQFFPQHKGAEHWIILAMMISGSLLTLFFMGLFIYFRKNQQTNANIITALHLFGAMSNFIGLIWWFLVPVANYICGCRQWFTFFGYSVQLSSIFTKTWLFRQVYRQKNTLGDHDWNWFSDPRVTLWFGVTSSISVQIILLTIWSAVDIFSTRILVYDSMARYYVYGCNSNSLYVWLALEAAYFVFIVACGLVILYSIWDYKGEIAESRWILMSLYVIIVSVGVVVALLTLRNYEDFLVVVVAYPIFVTTLFTMLAVSVPKLLTFYGYKTEAAEDDKKEEESSHWRQRRQSQTLDRIDNYKSRFELASQTPPPEGAGETSPRSPPSPRTSFAEKIKHPRTKPKKENKEKDVVQPGGYASYSDDEQPATATQPLDKDKKRTKAPPVASDGYTDYNNDSTEEPPKKEPKKRDKIAKAIIPGKKKDPLAATPKATPAGGYNDYSSGEDEPPPSPKHKPKPKAEAASGYYNYSTSDDEVGTTGGAGDDAKTDGYMDYSDSSSAGSSSSSSDPIRRKKPIVSKIVPQALQSKKTGVQTTIVFADSDSSKKKPKNKDPEPDTPSSRGPSKKSNSKKLPTVSESQNNKPKDECARDWNSEFQSLLERKDSIEKFTKLRQLASDFAWTAKTYGRIIIGEMMVENQFKTIKPVSQFGGVAGGSKYVVSGILFKLPSCTSSDVMMRLYGGDEWSAKASAAELRGLSSMFDAQVSDICVPLLSLLDYMGFRLIAISLLPIKGTETLRYGSADGALTICNSDKKLNSKMKEIAHELNLKEHWAGRKIPTKVHGPVDIEVHYGFDKRYYVVDAARLCPPEALPKLEPGQVRKQGQHLWRFLRPEVVKNNTEPLSSDSFSAFLPKEKSAENKAEAERVRAATTWVHTVLIPSYAKRLIQREKSGLDNLLEMVRSYPLHRCGLNVRMLGRVRKALFESGQECKLAITAVLIEILARTLKNLLREAIREKMRQIKVSAQEPYLDLVKEFFNTILGNNQAFLEKSVSFWQHLKIEAQNRFEFGLSAEEMSSSYNLWVQVHDHLPTIFFKLQDYAHISLTAPAAAEMKAHPTEFVAVEPDIKEMEVNSKQLNVIFQSEGTSLLMQAAATPSSAEEGRFLQMGNRSFQDAIVSATAVHSTLLQWGSLLFEVAKKEENGPVRQIEILTQCAEKYKDAINADPDLIEPHVQLSIVYGYWAALLTNPNRRMLFFSQACSHLIEAFTKDEDCLTPIVQQALVTQRTPLCVILKLISSSHLLSWDPKTTQPTVELFPEKIKPDVHILADSSSSPHNNHRKEGGLGGSSLRDSAFKRSRSRFTSKGFQDHNPTGNSGGGVTARSLTSTGRGESGGAGGSRDENRLRVMKSHGSNSGPTEGKLDMRAQLVRNAIVDQYKAITPWKILDLSTKGYNLLDYELLALILAVAGSTIETLLIPDYPILQMTDADLISDHCANLKNLDCSFSDYDPKAIKHLKARIPGLKSMKFLHSPERKKEERELVEKSLKYGLDLKFLQDQRAEKHLRDEPDLSGRLYVVMEQAIIQNNFIIQPEKKREWEELVDPRLLQMPSQELLEGIMDLSEKNRLTRLLAYSLKDLHTKEPGPAVPILHQLLDDPSEQVVVWAVICLGQIASGSAIKPLMQRTKVEKSQRVKFVMNAAISKYTAARAGVVVGKIDKPGGKKKVN